MHIRKTLSLFFEGRRLTSSFVFIAQISPLILPLCAFYFAMAYLMYKYQLLYVYINSYQSGGYMWYAVFNRSMVVLMAGVCTLLCYLAIRMSYTSAPFYLLLPLPGLIILFWHHCEKRIRGPAMVRLTVITFTLRLAHNCSDFL